MLSLHFIVRHHVLSRVFHAYYGCHQRHVVTTLPLSTPRMWHTMWRSCSAWWCKVLTQSSTAHWHGLLLLAGEVHKLSYFTMTISVDTTTMLSLHYYHYHDVLWLPPPTCWHCASSAGTMCYHECSMPTMAATNDM